MTLKKKPAATIEWAQLYNFDAFLEHIASGALDERLDSIFQVVVARRNKVQPIKRRKRPKEADPELADAMNNHGQDVEVSSLDWRDASYFCREPMCGQHFADKDEFYEHRRVVHGKAPQRRRSGPPIQKFDPSQWVEWIGRAVPYGGGVDAAVVDRESLVKIFGRFYRKSDFKGKCIKVPQDFGNSVSGARIVIDGVGDKMVKVRFVDPVPASSRYHKPASRGAPCFMAHAVLKEHLAS